MNVVVKSAIAIGAVSFAVTLWVLKSGPADPTSAASGGAEPNPAAHDAPRFLATDFDSALRAAAEIGSSPEGLKYQDAAGPVLSSVLQDRVASCLVGSSPLDQSAFAIVIRVAPDGAVTTTWAAPETPLASCVLHRLKGAQLPPPPMPDIWMAANITPDAAEPEADPE